MLDVKLNQEAADGHSIMTVKQIWESVCQSRIQGTPQNKRNVNGGVVLYTRHASLTHKMSLMKRLRIIKSM